MSVSSETKTSTCKAGLGADPNRPLCKKAKLLRIEKKQQKMIQRGMSLGKLSTKNTAKSLDDFLNEVSENPKHQLKVSAYCSHSKSYKIVILLDKISVDRQT